MPEVFFRGVDSFSENTFSDFVLNGKSWCWWMGVKTDKILHEQHSVWSKCL